MITGFYILHTVDPTVVQNNAEQELSEKTNTQSPEELKAHRK